ncbi:RTA1 like protein-domain-containing protein [Annulohypoxylon moriforme]|nr:RTA1 like protein-domain-containing protein [Annulohypoxylon moriforme]
MTNKYEGISFWIYIPNKGAAIFFLLAFLVSAQIHLCRYRCFKVTGLFVISGFLYVVGFALRMNGAFGNYDQLAPYIVSVALIYVSPPLLSLANYDILGRIFYYVPYLSPMEPGRVLSTFALLSMVIEGINGVAASFMANPDSNPTVGSGLMWSALVLQIAVIICFLIIAGYFHAKCVQAGIAWHPGIRDNLITLYISVGLILIRTIYRGVEHSVNAVVSTEWPFYVFEAALMLINMFMWNIRHPAPYLPSDITTYLSRDGVTEIKGPDLPKDARPLIARILDPWRMMDIFRGRDKSKNEIYQDIEQNGNELPSNYMRRPHRVESIYDRGQEHPKK